MTIHSDIQAGRSAVRSSFHRIRELVEGNQLEKAAAEAERVAGQLWMNGLGIFNSSELEAALAALGRRLELAVPSTDRHQRRGQVTVVTQLYGTGGHSRIVWRMMRIRSGEQHTLVLTRQGAAALPEQILALEREGALRIVRADAGSLAERARALATEVAGAAHVVLLTHPDDALPTIVLGANDAPPPVLLVDHATHAFWLGATITNTVLSVAPGPLFRRGFADGQIVHGPLPLDLDRPAPTGTRRIRDQLGIPPEAPLLFTCASDYKFYPIDDRQLAELVAPVLQRNPDAHLLAIGVSPTAMWTELAQRFTGRVHVAGHTHGADAIACYAEADIYLDSFPCPSLTAMLEAATHGKPIVRHAPTDWQECGFTFDYEGLDADAYVWTTAEDYQADLDRLIADREYRLARGARNRAQVQERHAAEAFSRAFEQALRTAAASPRLEPIASGHDGTIDQLDELLYKLAYNNAVQTGLRPAISPQQQLENWLEARRLTPAQRSLIEAQLGPLAERPRIGLVIRCEDGSADMQQALERTLLSIGELDPALPPAAVAILADASLPAELPARLCAQARLHRCASADHSAAINHIAATTECDWLLTLEAGDALTPSGLLMVALEASRADGVRAVYADGMVRLGDGSLSAAMRPDFNLDMLLSAPAMMARHWLFRREVFLAAGGLDAAAEPQVAEFDLLLRLIEAEGLVGLGHVAEPMVIAEIRQIGTHQSEIDALCRHLRNRGYEQATVTAHQPGCYRIHYGHAGNPGVSIIIPTRDQLPMLQRCVESLLEKTAYRNYEVLIVDNGSSDADACLWLDGIEAMGSAQLRVLRYPHPFNYSAMNNLAARHARGDYLVLLNNDTAVLREDWLDAMLNHAQRPEVGVVGAKLLYPDSRVQHAGVVLGLRGPAEHPFNGEKMDAPGYLYRLQVDQDYSAVTGACLMVRKSLFEEVGGLDEEAFKVSYNDVDLCLKTREAGYLTVWTPHAVLLHEGSVSQTRIDAAALEGKRLRFQGEQDAFYGKWLPVIARDPAYNPNLSIHGSGFTLEPESQLNWRPLDRLAQRLPVTLAIAGDQSGCGQYRVIQPTRALNEAGIADAQWSARYFNPVEMERLSPDVVVLQRQMFEADIEKQKRGTRYSRAFKVAELDDYLPNVPRKSAHHGAMPRDVLRTMRKSLALVDRFVVSTPALAEAFAGMHADIRVVENHLPPHWWANLQGKRRDGKRPRVGWGGGAGHRGDLELVADVVQALAGEVDWVFFGMCPDKLRPYVREFHPGVAIDQYPARLAGLDLDLAIAPLEDNLFNQCKSNLRLLEYGACGFPVVCSDVRPYQCDLPVTRVKPRFRDWVDAIRMHTSDLDAAARAGQVLRATVHRDWMLDEAHARFWLSQWLPD